MTTRTIRRHPYVVHPLADGSFVGAICGSISRAIRIGHERLDTELLDRIRLDEGAESGQTDRERQCATQCRRERAHQRGTA